jgi:hypothetical protein
VDEANWLAERFEAHRSHLRAVAYRMLGTLDARLPEPVEGVQDGVDPEHQALLADSVGPALLVVLDTPARRPRTPSRARPGRHRRLLRSSTP